MLMTYALQPKVQARSSKLSKWITNSKLKVMDPQAIIYGQTTRDKDSTLVCQPKKYIERLVESYHSMFKQDPPKNMRTSLDKNDHPEWDDTELLNGEFIHHFLTTVGQLQWLVTLGRFDIHVVVTIQVCSMERAPRKATKDVLKTKHYMQQNLPYDSKIAYYLWTHHTDP